MVASIPLKTSENLRQKTSGFLMFSGDIERDQWHEMGQVECDIENQQIN